MHYLIAIDSDGTLKHTDGTISDRTKDIIRKTNINHIVVICTARPRYHTLNISNEIGCDRYIISSNGTEVFDNVENRVIWSAYLLSSDCQKIYDDTSKLGLRTVFVCDNVEYVTHFIRNDFQILLNDKNINEMLSKKIKQIMIIGTDKEKIKTYQERILKDYKLNVIDTSNNSKKEIWFSIISQNASKGEALKRLSQYLNIPNENVIAIGNDNNDLSMIKMAGIGIAVANATPNLKKRADKIIKSNDEDGVYHFLKKLIVEHNK